MTTFFTKKNFSAINNNNNFAHEVHVRHPNVSH
ncbi:hypothetical protein RO3G_07131 [Rhizopus delemar RA 99-880]|uniref:Uncharacterized protein n=1 Tax=Rhizopus delemar (strain RA 99-880 / ATCC MYA-4621 / FGSC 9543 / NRRL 43880) TaxID=246409 RepID=I1C1U6_RHIO9|nr:hypothetical protein RO3G_07131 [Rhizopus delemar RA 99-880]|eukprot:EIE82426.1 hypothetical protein RO3G_07131 [Rhizopus delemar RA 99-880]